MAHKCDGCYLKEDHGEYPICKAMWYSVHEVAKGRCEIPGPCPDYISIDDVIRIADRLNDIPN